MKRNFSIFGLLIVAPYLVALYVSNAQLTWGQSILITKIINYTTMTLVCAAGIYLIVMNIRELKQKNQSNKMLFILFILIGLVAFFYGLFVLILLTAFRNGINF